AGHNPPMLLGGPGEIVMLEAKGIALGVMPDIKLEEKEIALEKGAVVVFYTDGVTEAINSSEEQFGQARLARVVQETHQLSAQGIIDRIQEEVRAFTKGHPQFDDITLIVLKCLQDGES
ncbi:MAG: PP2C family protein-serine/threonine phosphatase, partial [Chloroflexi bacterium]|nr:PP2C family protein-serine/threonine phosphatase [Chloroflexota bacterium]